MADNQITCIVKPDVNSPHEHITHVGGTNWTITTAECIAYIRNGIHSFFVQDLRGNRANVTIVPASQGRREHIRTVADNKYTDNLLCLNQCSL